MKKTIIQLDKAIIKELGKRNTAVYERGENWYVEVPEDNYDDAVEIIKEAGWEIVSEDWFSGSNYDGYAFMIK